MTDKVETYRSDAKQPLVRPPSPWPNRWRRVRGPLGRLGACVLIAAGPLASASLMLLSPFFFELVLAHAFIACIVPIYVKKSTVQKLIIAAWAPIVLPGLAVQRLARWIGTGN